MNGSLDTTALALLEPVLCCLTLVLIVASRRQSECKFFMAFLFRRILFAMLLLPLYFFGGHGIEPHLAYRLYFYTYWVGFGIETILALLIIYSIFKLAMTPLEGIRELGLMVFRWAACISLVTAFGAVLMPRLNEKIFITNLVTEVQRTESILTLCLLLFVCFAIRPLGLSYRSRIFGILLGLGVLATTNLMTSAWMAHAKQMYSIVNLINGVATCAALSLWIAYFALPESKRRIVVLPTTSPFLRWNQIAQALGDAPGFVAVGGIPPELFAPAELEVMRRASLKMMNQQAVSLGGVQTA